MSPQRLINIDQSVRVLKFFRGTLQLEPGGVTTIYFFQTQAAITASDQWIVAVEGPDAGNKEDVRNYLRGATVPPEDSITLSINLAMYLLSGIEYLEAKAKLLP